MRYKIDRISRVLLFIFGKTAGAEFNMKFNKIIVPDNGIDHLKSR
jgi:hypothetical protein